MSADRPTFDGPGWVHAGGHQNDPLVHAAWSESLLRSVDDEVRSDLLADAVSSTFPAGYWVQQIDYEWMIEAYPVTLVVDGVFRAYFGSKNGRQATVQYLRQGDVWGLVRCLSEERLFEQRIGYQALVASRVLVISGAKFMAAVEADPRVAVALARELARTVILRTTALESSLFSNTSTRIAQHLAQLAVEDEAGVPTVLLSQQDIADAVGTVREVVTRIIGQFRTQGIVQYAGRHLEILDMEALVRESHME